MPDFSLRDDFEGSINAYWSATSYFQTNPQITSFLTDTLGVDSCIVASNSQSGFLPFLPSSIPAGDDFSFEFGVRMNQYLVDSTGDNYAGIGLKIGSDSNPSVLLEWVNPQATNNQVIRFSLNGTPTDISGYAYSIGQLIKLKFVRVSGVITAYWYNPFSLNAWLPVGTVVNSNVAVMLTASSRGPYTDNYIPGFSYFSLEYTNTNPTATITATPDLGKAPLDVNLAAALNSAPSFKIDGVVWNFGDGIQGNGVDLKHSYLNAGTYNVLATITASYVDDNGNAVSKTITATTTISVYEKISVSLLDKCYRYGFNNMAQGYGFSEFNGSDWPFPPVSVGGAYCIDDLNQMHQVVFDNLSGTFREISMIQGPSGSNLALKFTDENKLGTLSEISGSIEFPETTGSVEEDKIEHGASYLNTRPFSEASKGATGYDANGYRTAQQLDVLLYMDGDTTKPYETDNIPAKAEVVFDRRAQGRRGRIKINFAASEIIFTKLRQMWVAKNKAGSLAVRTMSDQNYQSQLANPIIFYSRSYDNYLLNRITGQKMKVWTRSGPERDATPSDITLITGPDGNSSSAIQFSAIMDLGTIVDPTATDFKFMFWSNSLYWTMIINTSQGDPGTLNLGYTDFDLIGTINGWSLYALSHNFGIYTPVWNLFCYPVVGHSVGLFDLRYFQGITPGAGVSDDAVTSYFKDVQNNYGNSFLPLFP